MYESPNLIIGATVMYVDARKRFTDIKSQRKNLSAGRIIPTRRNTAKQINAVAKFAEQPAATMMLYFQVGGICANGMYVVEMTVHLVPMTRSMPQCPMISCAMFTPA